MHSLLACGHIQPFVPVALIVGIPESRPAHHNDDPFIARIQIVIGPLPGRTGLTAVTDRFSRTKGVLLAGIEHGHLGGIIVGGDKGAAPVMQAIFAIGGPLEIGIQGHDVFNHRGIRLAVIRQVNSPLDTFIVAIFQSFPANLQAGFRILPGQNMSGPILVEFLMLGVKLPAFQQFVRRFPIIGEGERRLCVLIIVLLSPGTIGIVGTDLHLGHCTSPEQPVLGRRSEILDLDGELADIIRPSAGLDLAGSNKVQIARRCGNQNFEIGNGIFFTDVGIVMNPQRTFDPVVTEGAGGRNIAQRPTHGVPGTVDLEGSWIGCIASYGGKNGDHRMIFIRAEEIHTENAQIAVAFKMEGIGGTAHFRAEFHHMAALVIHPFCLNDIFDDVTGI